MTTIHRWTIATESPGVILRFYTTKAVPALDPHTGQKSFELFLLDPANGYVPSALTKAAATALNHLQKNRSLADNKKGGKNQNKNLQRRKSEGPVPG